MLMDVRCRFKKHSLHLIFCAHSQLQFSKLILQALEMEEENAEYKLVQLIEERVQLGESTGYLPQILLSGMYEVIGMAAWKDSQWLL